MVLHGLIEGCCQVLLQECFSGILESLFDSCFRSKNSNSNNRINHSYSGSSLGTPRRNHDSIDLSTAQEITDSNLDFDESSHSLIRNEDEKWCRHGFAGNCSHCHDNQIDNLTLGVQMLNR